MPWAAGILRNAIAKASSEGQDVAAGVTLFPAFADAQTESTFETLVIQTSACGRRISPPTILLVLGEDSAQVGIELVVRVVVASL